MTTPSTNELMQTGIQQVRDGRAVEAYQTFRDVVARDPNNEFGWIWVSVTSNDRAEKRNALERALQINPNSQHAREALRSLEAEEAKSASTIPTPPPPPFPTAPMSPPPRIGEREFDTAPQFGPPPSKGDPLRAALTTDNKKKAKTKPAKNTPTPRNSTMVSRKPARRSRSPLLLLAGLLAVLVIGGLIAYFLLNPPAKPQASTGATTVAATTDSATTAADTTSASDTTAASATTTDAATSPATTDTTTPSVTTPATTLAPTTAAPITPFTLPSGANQTAQIAKALQTARDSQSSGDYRSAISAYEAALQADPSNVPANLGLGTAYLNAPDNALPTTTNRYQEAVRALRTVTSQAPNWSGGYALLGEALAGAGDVNGAIQAYSKSLELDPNGPERWLALANLYDKNNQPDQARFARERATGATATATTAPPTTTQPPTTTVPPKTTQPPAPPKTTQPPAPKTNPPTPKK